jgi:hypothetical protein
MLSADIPGLETDACPRQPNAAHAWEGKMMEQKIPHQPHVVRPGTPADFITVIEHPYTKRAGLGYAILSALGAHERTGSAALELVANWSAQYGKAHGGVTPDTANLTGQDFETRVGSAWGADRAAENASRYPGGRQGRPSYEDIHREVWIEQRWPDLCVALSRTPR